MVMMSWSIIRFDDSDASSVCLYTAIDVDDAIQIYCCWKPCYDDRLLTFILDVADVGFNGAA